MIKILTSLCKVLMPCEINFIAQPAGYMTVKERQLDNFSRGRPPDDKGFASLSLPLAGSLELTPCLLVCTCDIVAREDLS